MATLKNDLSLHNLTFEDAIEMALDKPLRGLLAAIGATHWWCMPNNDDDDDSYYWQKVENKNSQVTAEISKKIKNDWLANTKKKESQWEEYRKHRKSHNSRKLMNSVRRVSDVHGIGTDMKAAAGRKDVIVKTSCRDDEDWLLTATNGRRLYRLHLKVIDDSIDDTESLPV